MLRDQQRQREQQRHSTTPRSTIIVATAPAETSQAAESRNPLPLRSKCGRPPKAVMAPQAATSSAIVGVIAARSSAKTATLTESEDLSEVGQGKRIKMPSWKEKDREEQRVQAGQEKHYAHK